MLLKSRFIVIFKAVVRLRRKKIFYDIRGENKRGAGGGVKVYVNHKLVRLILV